MFWWTNKTCAAFFFNCADGLVDLGQGFFFFFFFFLCWEVLFFDIVLHFFISFAFFVSIRKLVLW
jgi:hypothetical protein